MIRLTLNLALMVKYGLVHLQYYRLQHTKALSFITEILIQTTKLLLNFFFPTICNRLFIRISKQINHRNASKTKRTLIVKLMFRSHIYTHHRSTFPIKSIKCFESKIRIRKRQTKCGKKKLEFKISSSVSLWNTSDYTNSNSISLGYYHGYPLSPRKTNPFRV